MKIFARASRGRRTIASIAALVVAAGVPVTFAVLHNGFPVSDVKLNVKDVWVTNESTNQVARLNRQIDELTAGALTTSNDFDVTQDGAYVFLQDKSASTLQRITRSRATLVQKTGIPQNATVALGESHLAVLDPAGGRLWLTDVANGLNLDTGSKPTAKLGSDAQVAAGKDGRIYATDPSAKKLFMWTDPGAQPTVTSMDIPSDTQLSVVGDTAVMLDASGKQLLTSDGKKIDIPAGAQQLQQPGAANSYALVSTENGTLRVPLGGGTPVATQANIADQTTGVAQPVFLDGCDYAAWAGSQRYFQQCGSGAPKLLTIGAPTRGDDLVFRVNQKVIALNDIQTGNTWILSTKLIIVNNWDQVRPPQESKTKKGKQKTTEESFQDQLAHRTNVNHPPNAKPDSYGIRPGRTTILPVLDNDSDQDGDVLTITKVTAIPPSWGAISYIDGGRALQLTPAKTASGPANFHYTAIDGRGGQSTTTVAMQIVPTSENHAPKELRSPTTSVELGQSITYDVLPDWTDPDGDDLELKSATATTGDVVRFTPDGYITFQSKSGTQGQKKVNFVVTDGSLTQSGTLTVSVKGAGSLTPIGTPDFASMFAGDTTVVQPLQNDLSPSGKPMTLVSVSAPPATATVIPNLAKGTVSVSSTTPGTIYLTYKVASGGQQGEGIIRVDVQKAPNTERPPIAVKDIAYLRAGQNLSLKVLANDVSPTGAVLSVQSVDTDGTTQALKVQLLNNTLVRLTAPNGLTQQTQFSYTISDGTQTAVGGVTVIPVAPLVDRQPPIAVDDAATVRAGDFASVSVLSNDYSPDQEQIFLDPTLAATGDDGGGLAFVNGSTVRYQAPSKAGVYSVVYRIRDQYDETATGKVTFTVTAPNAKTNRPPAPVDQTARAYAGQTVKIDVPLDGIDPDGDSVQLAGIEQPPGLGRISNPGPDSFDYTALTSSAGTDTFTYAVTDTYGARATGTIHVGIIPRGDVNDPPNAVNDNVEVKPGKTVSSQVLANDSDPNGFKLTLLSKLTDVAPSLKAHVSNQKVVITAPKKQGEYSLQYEITNGHGGNDKAFVIVKVTKDAKPQYPTATDYYVPFTKVKGRTPIKVDVSSLINNPNGEDSALLLSAEGPNGGNALIDQHADTITVTPREQRYAVAYRVTDPDVPSLTGTAFIVVPAYGSDANPLQPYLKNPLPKQVVPENGSKTWDLKDIVVDPNGRKVIVTGAANVKAINGVNAKAYVDKDTIRFVAAHNYRGTAALVFQVTDGSSADDPKGVKATLTLPITVGDSNYDDVAPQFTQLKIPIQAGEKAEVRDLRDSTSDPNQSLVSQFTYSGLSGATKDIQAGLNGSKLTVSAPLGVQPGATATLSFHIKYKSFDVPGKAIVTVVKSTRPLAQAVEDDQKGVRNQAITENVLANDYNPYADLHKPLKLIAAKVENSAETSAQLSFTADGTITVTPDPTFIGVVSIVYTERDASEDPSRDVQGRYLLTVRDRPSQPNAPSAQPGDKQATVSWEAPATNGEPIIDYTITTNGPGSIPQKTVDASQAQVVIGGLTNGQNYSFQVSARNELGDSTVSNPSAAIVPYGKPFAPSNPTISGSSDGSGKLTLSWGAASNNGSNVSQYHWTLSDGSTGTTTALSVQVSGHVGTSYHFSVAAENAAGTGDSATSGNDTPTPGAPASANITGSSDGSGRISMTWGAAPSTEPITRYEISINSGAWTDEGTSRSDTKTEAVGSTYSFRVRAYSGGQVSAITTSGSATTSAPAPPTYSGDVNVDSCPEQRSGSGTTNHFTPGSPARCSSKHGFVPKGAHVQLFCGFPNNGHVWYEFDGGGYTHAEGWLIRNDTMNNISGGIPGC